MVFWYFLQLQLVRIHRTHNFSISGMIFYHPGYYDANHAMLFHLAPHPFYGRSASAGMSAFAAGDSIAAGTYLRGE